MRLAPATERQGVGWGRINRGLAILVAVLVVILLIVLALPFVT